MTLVRSTEATWWELIAARADNRRVVLSLSERCKPRRVEGLVEQVAMTGAFAVVGGWHVPLEDIQGVHRPHHSQKAVA